LIISQIGFHGKVAEMRKKTSSPLMFQFSRNVSFYSGKESIETSKAIALFCLPIKRFSRDLLRKSAGNEL